MLAKVLKSQPHNAFAPFVIPGAGASSHAIVEGVSAFAFPAALDLSQGTKTEIVANKLLPSENFDEDILESARREAAAIVANAEAHSAAIEQAALEKGLQQADQTIAAEVAEQTAALRQQLTETINTVSGLRAAIAAEVESDVVRLALEIARKIVAREVTIDREIALTLTRVALGRLNSRAVAAVHLHPEDFVYVENHREKLHFHGSLELVEDRSIERGGCLVRTASGDTDARLESQFAEIAEGLLD